MDIEIKPILQAMQDAKRIQVAAWTFWSGRIDQQRVVVCRTECGPTNAAAATTVGIERFHPRLIINQGCAGAQIRDLRIGDIVLGESTAEYGLFISDHGDVGTGVKLERWKPEINAIRVGGQREFRFSSLPGDAAALEVAASTPYDAGRLIRGRIGSANQWNRELDLLAWNHDNFGTISEDMESAFSAMVARAYDVRFLAIRVISDNEWIGPEVRLKETTTACAKYVVEVIRRLPPHMSE